MFWKSLGPKEPLERVFAGVTKRLCGQQEALTLIHLTKASGTDLLFSKTRAGRDPGGTRGCSAAMRGPAGPSDPAIIISWSHQSMDTEGGLDGASVPCPAPHSDSVPVWPEGRQGLPPSRTSYSLSTEQSLEEISRWHPCISESGPLATPAPTSVAPRG